MDWQNDPTHAFTGISEKLNRAKENIFNLDAEITDFFKKSDYPVLPEDDREVLLKAIEYHKSLVIPPRFGVLSGEIVHHLRSCFDHIAWHFSDVSLVENIRKIEFPVFENPLNHDSRRAFKGKVEGITNPKVLALIERLQPYKAANPLDDPLWIIHDFDIIDKHKELVFSEPSGTRFFPAEMRNTIEAYHRAHPELSLAYVAHQFKEYAPLVPQISFRDVGGREAQPVIECLAKLFDFTVGAMEEFAAL